MNPEDTLFALLDAKGYSYQITRHPAAYTYEDMVHLGITEKGEVL